MTPMHSAPSRGRSGAAVDAAELLKDTVLDVLGLRPADFDPQYSLAEMGCDSLDVLDILYRLEMKLDAPGYRLREPADFNPLKEPLTRLEQHMHSALSRG